MDTISFEKLMEDPSFVEKLEAVDSIEAAEALFTEKGVVVDFEEMKAKLAVEKADLTEEDLDNVAGGGAIGTAWKIGKALGIIARTLIDDKLGRRRAYSWKDIKWAMDYIG